MDKSGIVTYKCKIDGKKYIISTNASSGEYEFYIYTFLTIKECIDCIDDYARSNIKFSGPEI